MADTGREKEDSGTWNLRKKEISKCVCVCTCVPICVRVCACACVMKQYVFTLLKE